MRKKITNIEKEVSLMLTANEVCTSHNIRTCVCMLEKIS